MEPKDQIKSTVDIEAYARDRYGLSFDRKGWTHCPFSENHNNGDATASLHHNRERSLICCFSQGCFGEKGVDIYGFEMTMGSVDFRTALVSLSEYSGIPLKGQPRETTIMTQKTTATFDYQDEDGNLLYQILRKEPGKGGRDKDFVIRQPNGKSG